MTQTDNVLAFVKVEVFTHYDPRTGRTRAWNATALYDYAVRFPNLVERATLDLEPQIVEMCRAKRGVEQWRLDRLCEPYLSLPIVMVELEERTHLMVDGNHRYVRRWEMGYSLINAYIYALGQWEPFLVPVVEG